MKVLSGALVALALLAGGLTMPSVASAAPYPHTVATTCRSIPKPVTVRVGNRPAVAFRIRVDGNANPKTAVKVRAVKAGTKKVLWKTVRHYQGHRTIWLLKKLPKGIYRIKYRTAFGSQSVYKNCRASYLTYIVP